MGKKKWSAKVDNPKNKGINPLNLEQRAEKRIREVMKSMARDLKKERANE